MLELLGPLPHLSDQRILLIDREGVGLLPQFELGDLSSDLVRTDALPGLKCEAHLPYPDNGLLDLLARRLPSIPKFGDATTERVVLFVQLLDLSLGSLAAVVDRLLLGRNSSDVGDQVLPSVEERAELRVD